MRMLVPSAPQGPKIRIPQPPDRQSLPIGARHRGAAPRGLPPVRRRDRRRQLEIGFGGGEHLIAEAQAFPNIGFIGCEPYVNGMAKILTQIEAHNIGNVRLYAGDAAELLAWAPPRSLARIDLIHPDPWPKRRHWKRRFVQDRTVNAMATSEDGGEFLSSATRRSALDLAHLMRATLFLERGARRDWQRRGTLPWTYGAKPARGRVAEYLRFRRLGRRACAAKSFSHIAS